MLCNKKIITEGSFDIYREIDFSWIKFIAMNRLGFTYTESGHLFFGLWTDLFEAFKHQYNFEVKKGIYDTKLSEPVSSLDAL